MPDSLNKVRPAACLCFEAKAQHQGFIPLCRGAVTESCRRCETVSMRHFLVFRENPDAKRCEKGKPLRSLLMERGGALVACLDRLCRTRGRARFGRAGSRRREEGQERGIPGVDL